MSLYDYDQTIVVGRAGKDAESRFLPNGTQITSFSVAVDRSYKDRNTGEKVKRAIWYRVTVFGNFAAVCQDTKKGQRVLVVGELEADWSTGGPKVYNKNDGSAGSSFELRASTVRFLSSRSESGAVEAAQSLGGVEVPEDDMPF